MRGREAERQRGREGKKEGEGERKRGRDLPSLQIPPPHTQEHTRKRYICGNQ